MSASLFDQRGVRKYLVPNERQQFLTAATNREAVTAGLCLTLALSGARISEVLSLTGERIDFSEGTIVFKTLKQRDKVAFRAVPVPERLLSHLLSMQPRDGQKLWQLGRTAAWQLVKTTMMDAKLADDLCKPKALRHGFAVDAILRGVPLNIVQRWLGHARIETTTIYTNIVGNEERELAARTWAQWGNGS